MARALKLGKLAPSAVDVFDWVLCSRVQVAAHVCPQVTLLHLRVALAMEGPAPATALRLDLVGNFLVVDLVPDYLDAYFQALAVYRPDGVQLQLLRRLAGNLLRAPSVLVDAPPLALADVEDRFAPRVAERVHVPAELLGDTGQEGERIASLVLIDRGDRGSLRQVLPRMSRPPWSV